MKAMTTLVLGLLLVGTAVDPATAQQGRDSGKAKTPQPELILVRVRAASDGTILDVDFVNSLRGKLVQTPTGVAKRTPSGGTTVAQDWEKIVTEGLIKLRKDQNLGDETEIRVSADDHLDFGAAMAAVECCQRAGLFNVDFAETSGSRVVVNIAQDGKFVVNDFTVSAYELKLHLQNMARQAGGPDRVAVTVNAHPQAKFTNVFRVLKDLKENGFRTTEVTAKDSPTRVETKPR